MIEKVKAYFETPALSQSEIKAILKGPHLVKIVEKNPYFFEESEAMLIGSLVDDIFSHNVDELNQKYYVGEIAEKPSDNIVSILRNVYKTRTSDDLFHQKDFIVEYANKLGYGKGKYSDDRIYNDVIKSLDYWHSILKMGERTLVSAEEFDLANKIVHNIKNHEYTKNIMFLKAHTFQVDLYFEYQELKCKALLDLVVYDEKTHTIYPYDFKTTGYNTMFHVVANKLNYPIQAVWYLLAIHKNRDVIADIFKIKNDFEIGEFRFITESTNNPGIPLVYSLSDETISKAQDDIDKGVELYKWHKEKDIWNISKEVYESGGQLCI